MDHVLRVLPLSVQHADGEEPTVRYVRLGLRTGWDDLHGADDDVCSGSVRERAAHRPIRDPNHRQRWCGGLRAGERRRVRGDVADVDAGLGPHPYAHRAALGRQRLPASDGLAVDGAGDDSLVPDTHPRQDHGVARDLLPVRRRRSVVPGVHADRLLRGGVRHRLARGVLGAGGDLRGGWHHLLLGHSQRAAGCRSAADRRRRRARSGGRCGAEADDRPEHPGHDQQPVHLGCGRHVLPARCQQIWLRELASGILGRSGRGRQAGASEHEGCDEAHHPPADRSSGRRTGRLGDGSVLRRSAGADDRPVAWRARAIVHRVPLHRPDQHGPGHRGAGSGGLLHVWPAHPDGRTRGPGLREEARLGRCGGVHRRHGLHRRQPRRLGRGGAH